MKALLNKQEFDSLTKNNQPIIKLQNMDLKETTTSYKLKVNLGVFDYLNKGRNGKSNYRNLWFYSPSLGENFRIKIALVKDEDIFNVLSDRMAIATQDLTNAYTIKELEDFLNTENVTIASSTVYPKINNTQNLLLLENFPPESSLADTKILPNGRLVQQTTEKLNTQDELTLYSVECETDLEFKKYGDNIGFLGIVIYPDVQIEDITTGTSLEQIRTFYGFGQTAIIYNLYNSDSSLNSFFVPKPELLTEEISLNQKNRYLESLVPKLSYSPKTTSTIAVRKDTFFSDLFSSESTKVAVESNKKTEIIINNFFIFDYLSYVVKKSSVYNFLNSFYTEEQLYEQLSKNDNKIFYSGFVSVKNLSNDEVYLPQDLTYKKIPSRFEINDPERLLLVDFADDISDTFQRQVTFKFSLVDPLIEFLFTTKEIMQNVLSLLEQYRCRVNFYTSQSYFLQNNKFNLPASEVLYLENLKNQILKQIDALSIFDQSFINSLDILLDPKNLNLNTLNTTIEKINFLFQNFIIQSQNYSIKTIEDEYRFITKYTRKTSSKEKIILTPIYLPEKKLIPHFTNEVIINSFLKNINDRFYMPLEINFGIRVVNALLALENVADKIYEQNQSVINPSDPSELNLAILCDFSKIYSKFWDFLYDQNFISNLTEDEINNLYNELTKDYKNDTSETNKKEYIQSIKNQYLNYFNGINNSDSKVLSSYKTKKLFQQLTLKQAISHFVLNAKYDVYVLSGFELKDGVRNMRNPKWQLIEPSMSNTFNFINSNKLGTVLNIAPLETDILGVKRPAEFSIPIFIDYLVYNSEKAGLR